jgi:hypothetical protein
MTPPAYLTAKTDVPVTMGRRVRSVAAVTDDVARVDPPGASDRDIVRRSKAIYGRMVMIAGRFY